MLESTRGRGVDKVLECAGSAETINAGIHMARQGGTGMMIGTLSELCLAWHQGQLVMERAVLVDVLADLFVRIDDIEGETLRRKR